MPRIPLVKTSSMGDLMWKRNLGKRQTWHEFFAFKRQLGMQAYDAALDTQGLLKSAMICRWARGQGPGVRLA